MQSILMLPQAVLKAWDMGLTGVRMLLLVQQRAES